MSKENQLTNVQKQGLLGFLGFYRGAVDGLWGPLSQKAQENFEAVYGIFTDYNLMDAVTGGKSFWEDIRYFTREEFRCKCGGKFCDGFPAEPNGLLLALADRVRDHFGAAANVSSGVRCQTHNVNVGGVPGSRHKLGKAMDFRVKGVPARKVLDFVLEQPETRYAYAISDSYVHMDVE